MLINTYIEKDTYEIRPILTTFLDIFGIELQSVLDNLVSKIELEISNNILEKQKWIANMSQQRKSTYVKLETKYDMYVSINIIYFTI